MKVKRYYAGNSPDENNYVLIGIASNFNKSNWMLYIKTGIMIDNWINMKIISKYKVKGRANFWIAYNLNEKRFANTKDSEYLEKKYHELKDDILSFIENNKSLMVSKMM